MKIGDTYKTNKKKKCLLGFYLIVRTLDRKSISIKNGDVAKNNQTNIFN